MALNFTAQPTLKNHCFNRAIDIARALSGLEPVGTCPHEAAKNGFLNTYRLPLEDVQTHGSFNRIEIDLVLLAARRVDPLRQAHITDDGTLNIRFNSAMSKPPVRAIRAELEKLQLEFSKCVKPCKRGDYRFMGSAALSALPLQHILKGIGPDVRCYFRLPETLIAHVHAPNAIVDEKTYISYLPRFEEVGLDSERVNCFHHAIIPKKSAAFVFEQLGMLKERGGRVN